MNNRGFTIFFAVLVASLTLAIGLAIYDLLIREIELSKTATESQYAIYAADTGAECALYWDLHYNGTDTAFATSTQSSPPVSNIFCNEQDIAAAAVAVSTWPVSSNALNATTTFQVSLISGNAASPCAIVTVAKSASSASDPSETVITSRGRNTCNFGAPLQLERALQIVY